MLAPHAEDFLSALLREITNPSRLAGGTWRLG
jgi:hypothetical protein